MKPTYSLIGSIFPLFIFGDIIYAFVKNPNQLTVLLTPIGISSAVGSFFVIALSVMMLVAFCVNWGSNDAKKWYHWLG